MKSIPLQAVPSQTLNVLLDQQNCRINIYQKEPGLFLDLLINDAPLISGIICLDRVLIVRQPYLGFVGNLIFADTLGLEDPYYTGLGDRFELVYLEAGESV